MAQVHTKNSISRYVNTTVPGYTIESEEFKIKFVGASQDGVQNYTMEYETDWEDVMSSLMLSLETFSMDVERAEQMAKGELETWARDQDGGEKLNLCMEVKFSERLQALSWVGGSKDLKVKFSDKSHTEANFIVVKKRIVRSLQDLAAESVSVSLKSFSSVSTFQLPIMLRMSVKKWYFDHWSKRHFNRKMYHYFKTRDVARRVSESMMVPRIDKPVKCRTKLFEKKGPKVKRLESRAIAVDRKRPKQTGLKKLTVDLGLLKQCPVCEKTDLRSVKIHMARSKACKRAVQEDY